MPWQQKKQSKAKRLGAQHRKAEAKPTKNWEGRQQHGNTTATTQKHQQHSNNNDTTNNTATTPDYQTNNNEDDLLWVGGERLQEV